jgi:GGDEF domain-containing protein
VVAELAERIGNAMAEPVAIDGFRLVTGAAIGISIYPEDARDARTLRKNADLAMYAVKRGGGRGYLVAGDLEDDAAASG